MRERSFPRDGTGEGGTKKKGGDETGRWFPAISARINGRFASIFRGSHAVGKRYVWWMRMCGASKSLKAPNISRFYLNKRGKFDKWRDLGANAKILNTQYQSRIREGGVRNVARGRTQVHCVLHDFVYALALDRQLQQQTAKILQCKMRVQYAHLRICKTLT